MTKMDWVEIMNFATRSEAAVAKSVLDSEGIEAQVQSDDVGGMNPYLSRLSGGVKLMVRQEDADEALKILQSAD